MRLGEIYSKHLNDEPAAQNAYHILRTQYRYSKAAIKLAQSPQPIVAPPPPEPVEKPAPVQPESKPRQSLSFLQSVRFWSTTDSTRVTIEFDLDTSYTHAKISSPDRLYLDISNARLGDKISDRTFQVSDQRLSQIRVGQNRSDLVRIVLDLAGKCTYSISELHNPFRIIIDLRRESAAATESEIVPLESNPRPVPQVSRPDSAASEAAAKSETKKIPELPQATQHPVPVSLPQTQPGAGVAEKSETPSRIESGSKPPASAITKRQAPEAIISAEPPKETEPLTAKAKESEEAKTVPKPELAGQSESKAPKSTRTENESEVPAAKDSKQAPAPVQSASIKPPPMKIPGTIATPKPASPTSQGDRTLTRMLGLKIGRVVLDPGHGGHDNGTIGPGGLYEKDLVLAIAQKLRKMLQEKLGAEVVLTRNDDTFIPLEERTAIANEHHADLFVSIHANSSRIRSISGVETYFLDFARTDAEREIAARENATALANVRDLEDLIKKIAQADKSLESRELASIIQKKLYGGAKQISPGTQNRGVRSAPFVVLIGANMPSILAEVAFISNPKDERLLKKEANRELLAKALFSGIEGYMKTLGSDVVDNQTKSK
jgi:N-acetylmuramoyl-L-alanine amidase